MTKALAALVLLFGASMAVAQAADPLQKAGETTLVSFQLKGSSKYVSICESSSSDHPYIVYRSGTASNVELSFPEDLADSWSRFEFASYLRGGGAQNEGLDLNHLSFNNGGWRYTVYQEYSAADDTTSVGVRLTRLSDKKKVDLPGTPGTLKGSLVSLRDEDRIPRGELPD